MATRRGEPPSKIAAAWSERELRELAAYLAHDPPLEARLDFWAAQLLAAAINPWRKKGSAATSPADLIPDWWGGGEARGPKSAAEWRELLGGLTARLGGKTTPAGKTDGPVGR